MNDIFEQMEEDFEKSIKDPLKHVDSNELGTIAEVAKSIRAKELRIATMEAQLKDLKKEHNKLTDEDLPNLLAEVGLSSFTLDDGSAVTVKQTYGASIRVDDRPKAFEWLRENGQRAVIKGSK